MDINYIILAHKNPLQVLRLVNQLNAPFCSFYIHIDKAIDILPFFESFSNLNNVYFVPENFRENGTWGDFGTVTGTIICLNEILNQNRNGYCVLLSGQDYPLTNSKKIHSFLTDKYGTHYISIFSLPHNGWGKYGGLERIKLYKFNLSNKRLDFILVPSIYNKQFYTFNSIKKVYTLVKNKKWKYLKMLLSPKKTAISIKHYGGGQWWALPTESIKKILNFINQNPKLLQFYKYSLIPDEMFFHSILMHIYKNKQLKIEPSLTYVNWERKNTTLPVTFTIYDFNELQQESKNKLFARKFDLDLDAAILDKIDRDVLN